MAPSHACPAAGEDTCAIRWGGHLRTPTPLKKKIFQQPSFHPASGQLAVCKSPPPDDKLLQGMINIFFSRAGIWEKQTDIQRDSLGSIHVQRLPINQ